MSKMHYFCNKFFKIVKRWGLSTRLTLNIHDLNSRDLAKLWIFKLIMKKSNFKKSVMTSF